MIKNRLKSIVILLVFDIFLVSAIYIMIEDLHLLLKFDDIIFFTNGSVFSIVTLSTLFVYFNMLFCISIFYYSSSLLTLAGKIILTSIVIGVLLQVVFSIYYYSELNKKGYIRCFGYPKNAFTIS